MPFGALPLEGPTFLTQFGPVLAWIAALLAALLFATRRRRVLRGGGWAAAALLVAMAGVHAHHVSLLRAQVQAVWALHVAENRGNQMAPSAVETPQDTAAAAKTATRESPGAERVVLVNGHLLPGTRAVLEQASQDGTLGPLLMIQPRAHSAGRWEPLLQQDAYGDALPADATLVVFLPPSQDPQGGPDTPPSADVVRVFVARTDARGVVDLMERRTWQAHHAVFQIPRFPWPLGTTFPWKPVPQDAVGHALVEALAPTGTPP